MGDYPTNCVYLASTLVSSFDLNKTPPLVLPVRGFVISIGKLIFVYQVEIKLECVTKRGWGWFGLSKSRVSLRSGWKLSRSPSALTQSQRLPLLPPIEVLSNPCKNRCHSGGENSQNGKFFGKKPNFFWNIAISKTLRGFWFLKISICFETL